MATVQKKPHIDFSEQDLEILNSPTGLKYLFADKKTDVQKALRMAKYEIELKELQAELVKLQSWVIDKGKKIVILFEGRDAAGKGGAIRRIAAHINPRYYRIVALPKPTEEEEGQWYFQRYVNQLPKPGEMVFFDRSWYNRAVVEPVNKFCTQKQYNTFMGQVNDFERMILESDTYLIKFYFSITKEEQEYRFRDIKTSPLKRWKMTRVDEKAQELWDEYTKYKVKMFEHTNTKHSPWIILEANKKTKARIEAIRYILNTIPFQK
ncbi:polyphosphate kinase 2 [Aquimarina gracilis]|uniref:ADP/GDP-polyphosphate phosphotransferase n=1 Tax=Aquimarina gracilis TaxID=874422 RepID=A0ABU5ZY15_9FLAO|nr:polyphosphate kinase 2 [Aquimarina gracilis]MEB3346710.1 polyphosphate kinase 2 [Aquimarina gracilis]